MKQEFARLSWEISLKNHNSRSVVPQSGKNYKVEGLCKTSSVNLDLNYFGGLVKITFIMIREHPQRCSYWIDLQRRTPGKWEKFHVFIFMFRYGQSKDHFELTAIIRCCCDRGVGCRMQEVHCTSHTDQWRHTSSHWLIHFYTSVSI